MKLRQIRLEQGLVDNPILTIESKDPPYVIEVSGAHSDRFTVFEDGQHVLVLKTNRAYQYAQLRAYYRGKEIAEFTIEGGMQIRSYLGNKGLKRSELQIASVLYALHPKSLRIPPPVK